MTYKSKNNIRTNNNPTASLLNYTPFRLTFGTADARLAQYSTGVQLLRLDKFAAAA
ncbi:MAG: hypothetical protein OEN50_17380 [Deltaproteobacteria bacterium]|nr:hypothetical protein [Deltaproteobacteria bacterium]